MSELSAAISAPSTSQTLDDFESVSDLTGESPSTNGPDLGIDLAASEFDFDSDFESDETPETSASNRPSTTSPEGQQDAIGDSDDSTIVPPSADAPNATLGDPATSVNSPESGSQPSADSPDSLETETNDKPLLTAEIAAIEESIARLCLEEQRLKARAKSCKAEREELTTELAGLLGRLDEPQRELPLSGDQQNKTTPAGSEVTITCQSTRTDSLPGQLELPLGSDNGSKQSVSVLRLTENQIDIFAGADIHTIGDLEQAMRDGRFTPGSIRGIGQTKIDSITDRLMEFRKLNPVPSDEAPANREPESKPELETIHKPVETAATAETTATETAAAPSPRKKRASATTTTKPDNGEGESTRNPAAGSDAVEIDPTAYAAGCEAAVNSESVATNPHNRGTNLWHSWDRGWQDTNT